MKRKIVLKINYPTDFIFKQKILLFSVLMALSHLTMLCQNKKADSLKSKLHQVKEDTSRINLLIELAWEVRTNNVDSSINLCNQALEILTQTKSINENRTQTLIAIAFQQLGMFYRLKENYLLSLNYYLKSYEIWKKNNVSDKEKRTSTVLGNIAIIYKLMGDYSNALKFYISALKIEEKSGDKSAVATRLTNIGNIYRVQADYPKALHYYFKSLKLKEELEDKGGVARNLGNIGIVYSEQNDFEKALEYYFNSLKIHQELDDKDGMAINYANIGIAYSDQQKNQQALDYYKKALALSEELNDKSGIAINLGNIGIIYKELGDYNTALNYYQRSLKMKQELGDKYGISLIFGNMGELYLKAKKYNDARRNLNNALFISKQINDKDGCKQWEKNLFYLDSTLGYFKEALAHYKNFIDYNDSINNEENTKKSVQIQMQYEFDKKSAADSIKNAEAKKLGDLKHQQEISRQRTLTYGGIGGFLVMIIVAGISYNAFRNKKKANIDIAHQKALVEEKQKEILDSIHYARRIQQALITNQKYIDRQLKKLKK